MSVPRLRSALILLAAALGLSACGYDRRLRLWRRLGRLRQRRLLRSLLWRLLSAAATARRLLRSLVRLVRRLLLSRHRHLRLRPLAAAATAGTTIIAAIGKAAAALARPRLERPALGELGRLPPRPARLATADRDGARAIGDSAGRSTRTQFGQTVARTRDSRAQRVRSQCGRRRRRWIAASAYARSANGTGSRCRMTGQAGRRRISTIEVKRSTGTSSWLMTVVCGAERADVGLAARRASRRRSRSRTRSVSPG